MLKIISRSTTFFLLLTSTHSFALKKVESTEKYQDITLTQSLELDEFEQIKLKVVGHGLRNKKVAFMNFKVYVGELLMPADATWNQKTLDYLAASPAGFQMTFLRNVPAEKLMEGFTESFKVNDVDVNSETLKTFLSAVKKVGELKEKDVMILARKKTENTDEVLILVPDRLKEIVTGPGGWSDSILKIIAGKPADSGLEKMQKELFK